MNLVCLDLEGVLVPEVWINVALKTGVDELKLTTRDISDYDVLMKKRISILEREGINLPDIQRVIGSMNPLKGAKRFLSTLREKIQVILLSDTFTQFSPPSVERKIPCSFSRLATNIFPSKIPTDAYPLPLRFQSLPILSLV